MDGRPDTVKQGPQGPFLRPRYSDRPTPSAKLIQIDSIPMTHPVTTMLQALLDKGFERLPPSSPDAYSDDRRRYATYRRDGVRVAFGSNRSLATHRGTVVEYDDDETCAVLHALITDPGVRGQGRGSKVMDAVLRAADAAGLELYVEPVPLDKGKGLSSEALGRFYGKFGFEAVDDTGKVLKRPAGPEPSLEP